MSALLARTHDALRIGRVHADLAVRSAKTPAVIRDEPCIGHKVAALQTAIRDLEDEHDLDLTPEARTILASFAKLGFRCKLLWKAS